MNYDDYIKIIRVIASCKTPRQLLAAKEYCILAGKQFNIGVDTMARIDTVYLIKYYELMDCTAGLAGS